MTSTPGTAGGHVLAPSLPESFKSTCGNVCTAFFSEKAAAVMPARVIGAKRTYQALRTSQS